MFRQIIFPILFFLLLPLWFKLLIKLRLGPALVYVILGNTVWLDWAAHHTALADGILFAILGVTALSWLVTFYRKSATVKSNNPCEECKSTPLFLGGDYGNPYQS